MKRHLIVEGMTCNHCRMSVKNALQALPTVHDVEVDLQTKRVTLEHDEGAVTDAVVRQAIEDIGFEVGALD